MEVCVCVCVCVCVFAHNESDFTSRDVSDPLQIFLTSEQLKMLYLHRTLFFLRLYHTSLFDLLLPLCSFTLENQIYRVRLKLGGSYFMFFAGNKMNEILDQKISLQLQTREV